MEDYERNLKLLEDQYDGWCITAMGALDITKARIEHAKRELDYSSERCPIDAIHGRIKKFDSLMEKCKRKGYTPDIEIIKKNVLDIAGIRIITPFRDDIFEVVKILHGIPGLNIEDEKDYVTNPKENGYSSYHMHVRVEVSDQITGGTKLVTVEIQIRDKAMDLWASIEHIIRYKNDNPDPRVEKRFRSIADSLVRFDELAIELRDFDPDDEPEEEASTDELDETDDDDSAEPNPQ